MHAWGGGCHLDVGHSDGQNDELFVLFDVKGRSQHGFEILKLAWTRPIWDTIHVANKVDRSVDLWSQLLLQCDITYWFLFWLKGVNQVIDHVDHPFAAQCSAKVTGLGTRARGREWAGKRPLRCFWQLPWSKCCFCQLSKLAVACNFVTDVMWSYWSLFSLANQPILKCIGTG